MTKRNIFLDPPADTVVKPVARIDHWYMTTTPHGDRVLIGQISGHPSQASFAHSYQVTSPVVSFDPLESFAETRNTVYQLGKPAELVKDTPFIPDL